MLIQHSTLKQTCGGIVLLLIGMAMALAGCEPQAEEQKVFDLEAPGVDIEVRESEEGDHGRIEIETGPDVEHEATPENPIERN